ncbi:MAG: hypothetical protein WAN11_24055 [Syntrophobacteraceae bacterium]
MRREISAIFGIAVLLGLAILVKPPPEIKTVEKPVIVKELEIVYVDRPVVVKEPEIIYRDKPQEPEKTTEKPLRPPDKTTEKPAELTEKPVPTKTAIGVPKKKLNRHPQAKIKANDCDCWITYHYQSSNPSEDQPTSSWNGSTGWSGRNWPTSSFNSGSPGTWARETEYPGRNVYRPQGWPSPNRRGSVEWSNGSSSGSWTGSRSSW